MSEYDRCKAGVLIYAGDEIVRLGERIVALPWQVLARAQYGLKIETLHLNQTPKNAVAIPLACIARLPLLDPEYDAA
jgi:hypothetical protein